MIKNLQYIIFLFPILTFSQLEKKDYEIYSIVINNESIYLKNKDTIVLVKQYERNQDFSLIEEFTKEKDKMEHYTLHYLYSMTNNDSIFQQKLLNNIELKNCLSGLINNFNSHPIIDTKKLTVGKFLATISSDKFYSYFKKSKRIESGWKKINNIYQTNWVIELSKINYNDKFACLYYANHCGGLCGVGKLILLEKVDGQWKIIGELETWVS